MRRVVSSRRTLLPMLLSLVVWVGCSDAPGELTSPDDLPIAVTTGNQVVDLSVAMDIQERHTGELMRVPGVVGTAVGLDAEGLPAVKVLVRRDVAGLPARLEGIPLEISVTGEFYALAQQVDAQARPTCGKRNLPPCPDPPPAPPPLDARHPRPVPLGVSVGHPAITAGTFGARVKSGSQVWALSNNHVFADINAASIGDAVIQPGTFDGGSSPSDDIGTLSAFQPISFVGCDNVMDAAIASTTTALAGNATPDGVGYGTPRATTMAAAVNMKVKKVGRTTGFTKGRWEPSTPPCR